MREQKKIEDNSVNDLSSQKIGFLEGRPKRSKIIGEGDIANLKIALNTSKNFEEFFGAV